MIVRITNEHSLGGGVDVTVGMLLDLPEKTALRKITTKDAELATDMEVAKFYEEQKARAAAAEKLATDDAKKAEKAAKLAAASNQ